MGGPHLFDDRFVIGRRDARLMKGDKSSFCPNLKNFFSLLYNPRRCHQIAGAFPTLESDADALLSIIANAGLPPALSDIPLLIKKSPEFQMSNRNNTLIDVLFPSVEKIVGIEVRDSRDSTARFNIFMLRGTIRAHKVNGQLLTADRLRRPERERRRASSANATQHCHPL
jgi:hypothetical protein